MTSNLGWNGAASMMRQYTGAFALARAKGSPVHRQPRPTARAVWDGNVEGLLAPLHVRLPPPAPIYYAGQAGAEQQEGSWFVNRV